MGVSALERDIDTRKYLKLSRNSKMPLGSRARHLYQEGTKRVVDNDDVNRSHIQNFRLLSAIRAPFYAALLDPKVRVRSLKLPDGRVNGRTA
jgi:hypothetical protein